MPRVKAATQKKESHAAEVAAPAPAAAPAAPKSSAKKAPVAKHSAKAAPAAAKGNKTSARDVALPDADLDGLDKKLLAKLESAKEISRDSLRQMIKEVHGGRGKDKLTDEDIESILDDTILMIADEHPEAEEGVDEEEGEEEDDFELDDEELIEISPELEAELDEKDKKFHAALDKHTGALDRETLKKIIKKCYGPAVSTEELDDMIDEALLTAVILGAQPGDDEEDDDEEPAPKSKKAKSAGKALKAAGKALTAAGKALKAAGKAPAKAATKKSKKVAKRPVKAKAVKAKAPAAKKSAKKSSK